MSEAHILDGEGLMWLHDAHIEKDEKKKKTAGIAKERSVGKSTGLCVRKGPPPTPRSSENHHHHLWLIFLS